MNAINKKTLLTGFIALAVGLALGVGGAELRAGTASSPDKTDVSAAKPAINSPNWDPFQEIRDMQMQMDNMFNRMSSEVQMQPKFGNIVENPAYSLSLNVRDLKDRFVVRAYLPDTKASDVNVKLDDNQHLKVEISNQKTQTTNKKDASTSVTEWGQFEQTIQLPAPVKSDGMKIERKNHELLITLPKAQA